MLQAFFHAWERQLADVTKDRVVRPFDWGLDWIPQNGDAHAATSDAAVDVLSDWVSHVCGDTDAFFRPPPTTEYTLAPAADGDMLTFPSAFVTPHKENNTVYARYFRGSNGSRSSNSSRAAVLVLPQWNADQGGHIRFSQLLAWNGISALRLSPPVHVWRFPPELRCAV